MRPIHFAVRHPRLRLDRKACAALVAALDAAAQRFRGGCPPGELSVAFLTDRALAGLHGQFLDDASPTDVITFPGDRAFGQAGEICISADAARRQGGSRGFSRELTLYLVHGWLHLAGYDDRTPAARRQMRQAERRAQSVLAAARMRPVFALRK